MSDTKFYKIGAAVLFTLVAIILVFMITGKKQKKKTATVNENPAVVSSLNVIEDSNSIGDLNTLNEIAILDVDDSSVDKEKTEKETIKENGIRNVDKTDKDVDTENTEAIETSTKVEEILDPVFKYPLEGEVSMEYAKEKLVYSNTLNEWITHPGIDIKGKKTDIVKASSAGTIKSIKNDPRYGLTVVIEHANGYETVYSNLLTAEFVSVGENVSGGQTIGTVGNDAAFEILDEPHLHFEILKDGEQIDPNMYLKD